MRAVATPLISAAFLLAPLPLPAQGTAAPPRRAHHALAYDPASRRVILTGGSTPHANGDCCAFFSDTWAFDGTRWTRLGESGDQRSGVGLAFDTRRNRLLSFGGYFGESRGDLRVLEQNAWRSLGTHPSIIAAEPGFVYDSQRDRFVAFGGSAGRGQVHGETWEYDGAAWKKLDIAGPAARQGHAMVYDSRRGRTIVFSGSGAASPGNPPPQLDDLWEFDGRAWTRKAIEGPLPRGAAGITFDSRRGLVILFGGAARGRFFNDLWAYDGTSWRRLAEGGPEPRAMGYIAYDAHRDRVVLFGGRKGWPNDLDDTWEWDGAAWTRVATGAP